MGMIGWIILALVVLLLLYVDAASTTGWSGCARW